VLDVGWQELFLIAIVALVVVGPKDLPKVLRSAARVMQKARAMNREFQASLAEMAREAELDEIKRKVEDTARFDLGDELRKSVDPTGKLSADFDPAEFNRQLKESVEGGPPLRAAAAIERPAGTLQPQASGTSSATRPVELPAAGDAPPQADTVPAVSGSHAPAPAEGTGDK
jgi:sec-independent protein translocase protein TatB